MFLSVLTFLTAISISIVAIYYSVAGLVAIFAAAAIPVIIMGTILEVAKLVTAVWLHRYWSQTVWWLKTYLSIAVVLLMFITSMGIFGFLSKAHIEQTASATENVARIEQIDAQINKKVTVINDAKSEITDLETSGTNSDAEIQSQIDAEQQRIDSAYERVQPAIDEQNTIIEKEEQRLGGGLSLYNAQLSSIDDNLKKIEQYIADNNIESLQVLVGVEADGNLGPATERAIEAYRTSQNLEKQRLTELIAQESSNVSSPVIDTARAEIQRLRSVTEQEIASSNELVNRLRLQLGNTDKEQTSASIAEQNTIIDKTEQEIATLTEQKFGLEAEYRKLEAEVGPIKYLAEFAYGNDANKDMLEEAVRWVIVLIILVFDPLAVLLLIASQYSFNIQRAIKKDKEDEPIIDDKKVDDYTNSDPATDSNNTEYPTANSSDQIAYNPAGAREVGNIVEIVEAVEPSTIDAAEQFVDRTAELAEKEQDEKWKLAKIRWKIDNPRANTKMLRQMYLDGSIEKLPWEEYMYIQNSEQGQSSLFTKIQQTKNEQD